MDYVASLIISGPDLNWRKKRRVGIAAITFISRKALVLFTVDRSGNSFPALNGPFDSRPVFRRFKIEFAR